MNVSVFNSVVFVGAMSSMTMLAVSAEIRPTEVEVSDCVVRFSEQIDVPAMESGRVDEVWVKSNDTVSSGTLMFKLDDRTLLIRRRAALLRASHARQDTLDDVELRYAETALAEAEAELDSSRSIQNDVRGAVPLTQMRRLRLAVDRGHLEVALAKKRRKQAEIEVQLREADLSAIDDQIENLAVFSPIDGVVLDVARAVGEWIERGQPIATIAAMDRLQIHALVDGEQISPSICTGLPVSVHWIDASTGRTKSLRGKVMSVDPETLPGNRFRVHAEVTNRADEHDSRQWQLRPGVDVRMKIYVPRGAPAGPSAAGDARRLR